jgi:hypothetical protein
MKARPILLVAGFAALALALFMFVPQPPARQEVEASHVNVSPTPAVTAPSELERPERRSDEREAGALPQRARTNPVAAPAPPLASSRSDIGSVFGRAVDEFGRDASFRNVEVRLHFQFAPLASRRRVSDALPEDSKRSAAISDKIALVDSNGDFDVEGLGLGQWAITCTLAGAEPISAQVTLTDYEPRVRHDFTFKATRVVRAYLSDARGLPLMQTLALGGSHAGEQLWPFVTTEMTQIGESPFLHGALKCRAQRPREPDGPWYSITIEANSRDSIWIGAALGDSALACVAVAPSADAVTLTVGTEQLSGRLGAVEITVGEGAQMRPLTSASVAISSLPQTWQPVDSFGRAHFADVLPGNARVFVRCQDYLRVELPVTVESGVTKRLEANLEPSFQISGTLIDSAGQPIHGHLVSVLSIKDQPDSQAEDAFSGSDGSFVVRGLTRSEYVMIDQAVVHPKHAPSLSEAKVSQPGQMYVDVRSGSVSGVVLVSRDSAREAHQ